MEKFKVVVLGDSAVGKTCLLRRAAAGGAAAGADAAMMSTLSTVGVDLASLDVRLPAASGSATSGGGRGAAADEKGVVVRLQVWDTAGQEKYRSIAESFYRGAAGILLVYDITRKSSFTNIQTWLASITAHTAGAGSLEVVLVGNKSDLASSRAVSEAAGREAAAALGIPFFEVSALTGAGVQAAVETLAARMLARARLTGAAGGGSRAAFSSVNFVQLAERQEAPPGASPAGGCEC
jgi:Ras-related protein Rab-1A